MEGDLSKWEQLTVAGGLWLVYLLLVLAVGLILFFGLRDIVKSKEGYKNLFIRLGALAVLYVIAWAVSPYDFKWSQVDKGVTPTNSGFIGGAIITVYFLLGIALAVIVFFELRNLIRRNNA